MAGRVDHLNSSPDQNLCQIGFTGMPTLPARHQTGARHKDHIGNRRNQRPACPVRIQQVQIAIARQMFAHHLALCSDPQFDDTQRRADQFYPEPGQTVPVQTLPDPVGQSRFGLTGWQGEQTNVVGPVAQGLWQSGELLDDQMAELKVQKPAPNRPAA